MRLVMGTRSIAATSMAKRHYNPIMRRTCVLMFLISLVMAATVHAQLARETIPGKWLNDVLPEDMPALDYPPDATPLDKARLESFTGRYKRSLQTLATLPPDANPVEVA